MNVLRVSNI